MNKKYNIEEEIEFINCMIDYAVEHGGDQGGAYLSCGETLCEAIEEWLDFRNLNNKYIVKCRQTGNFEKDYVIIKK